MRLGKTGAPSANVPVLWNPAALRGSKGCYLLDSSVTESAPRPVKAL